MGGAPKLNETKVEDLDDLDPPYIAYTGIDYRPGQNPAPKVMVEDIVAIFVEDPFECAVRCNDDDLCNSAAFYGNNPVGSWPQGLTCLLRVISVPCDVPDDYEQAEQTKTILLIAQDEDLCGACPCCTCLACCHCRALQGLGCPGMVSVQLAGVARGKCLRIRGFMSASP